MPEPRPNIVLIMVDDADRKVLEYSTRIQELVADEGATATRFMLTQPVCGPSRASVLRGQYSHNTGVEVNNHAYANFIAHGGEDSNVATWLHDAGYRTALVGKYMNHYPAQADQGDDYVPPKWDYWFGLFGDAYDSYNYHANFNGNVRRYRRRPSDYVTDVLREQALDFLDSDLADDPFLLVVTPMAPHSPSIAAPRHLGDYSGETYPRGAENPGFNEADVSDKPFFVSRLDELTDRQIAGIDDKFRRRLASMEAVEDMVAAIIDKLEDDGKLANTYVFFTSDNGFHMGEHRLGKYGVQDDAQRPAPGGKNTMYEEDTGVPLWVRGPGIAPGSTVEELLGNVDLAPTFCEIAGIPMGPGVDGRSLLPLLHGESIPWRTIFLISRGGNTSYAGIRSADDWVFAHLDAPQPLEPNGEYYDLVTDPFELDNGYNSLSDDELATLLARVSAYRVCSGDSCRVADSP